MAEPEVMDQMAADVTAALSRTGVAGRVVIREGAAELHIPGNEVVAVDVAEWIEQWALLPEDIRRRRSEGLAQRLRSAQVGQKPDVGARPKPLQLGRIIAGALALGVLGVTGWWLYSSGFFGVQDQPESRPPASAAAPPASALAASDKQRVERACEAARSRMRAGAAMGMDTKGWVVELWLGRRASSGAKLVSDEAITALQGGGSAAALGAPKPYEAKVVSGAPDAGADVLAVQFTGGYVTRFFGADGRSAFVDVSAALATTLKVDYAALYARCAHLPYHDVGAWYLGSSPKRAAGALLYAGLNADPAAVDRSKLSDAAELLPTLDAAAAADPAALRDAVAAVGGRLKTQPGGATSMRFALGGPTRAMKASRALARKLSLGGS